MMTDGEPDDLIPRPFAVLTARLEDGCTLAVEGQRIGLGHVQVQDLANQIHATGGDIRIIADAIIALAAKAADT